LGLAPGDQILLTEQGAFAQSSGWPFDTTTISAVFSRSNTFLNRSNTHRIPDAIKAGGGWVSPETWNSRVWTNIEEDFAITPNGVKVVIPTGAQYLFVASDDSFYRDNNTKTGVKLIVSKIAKASPKGQNALRRVLPYGQVLRSAALSVSNSGMISGWVGDATSSKATVFQNGKFTSTDSFGLNSAAYGVNSQNQVVGAGVLKDGSEHAYFFANGTTSDILNGKGRAVAVNSKGDVAGYSTSDDGRSYPYVTTNGKVHGIDTGGCAGFSTGINNAGDVVGFYVDWNWYPTPFISRAGKYKAEILNVDLKKVGAYPTAINDKGVIVGTYVTPNLWLAQPYAQVVRSFIFDGKNFADLGNLPGGQSVEATAINNNGQVVGSATTADGSTHAFLYDNGKMTDLGTLDGNASYAKSINDSGEIVGTALDAYGKEAAFVTYAQPHATAIQSVGISNNYFPEGSAVTGTLTLDSAAPAGGLTIKLSSNSGIANFPSTVTIPEEQTTVTFPITGNQTEKNTPFRITAAANGYTSYVDATVRSLTLQNFRLAKYTVAAGSSIAGSFRLESAALSNGKTVTLRTDNTAVTVDSSVSLSAGQQTGAFTVNVGKLASGTKVTVYAQCGDRSAQTVIFTIN
jgi:probable HAF family extracellular repeat protein